MSRERLERRHAEEGDQAGVAEAGFDEAADQSIISRTSASLISRELGVQLTGQAAETDQERAHRTSQILLRRQFGGAPGKRTRVQARYGTGGAAKRPAAQVQAVAQAGVEGSGRPLPHADRIQQSFGDHDVLGVRAHVGGEAASAAEAIGAEAFATGEDVAFRETPTLHTEAHEVAHVAQQRAGVSLDGGVGKPGDSYERNADAVADRVVAGESAADLLPAAGASAATSAQCQRKDAANGPEMTDHAAQVEDSERQPAARGGYSGIDVLGLATDLDALNSHVDSLYEERTRAVRDIYNNLQVKDPKPAVHESIMLTLVEFAVSEAIGWATGGLSGVIVGMISAAHAPEGKMATVHGAAHMVGHIIEKLTAKAAEEGAKQGIEAQHLPESKGFTNPKDLTAGRLYPEVAFFSGQCEALTEWKDDLKTQLGGFWKQLIAAHPHDPQALSAVINATSRAFVAAKNSAHQSQLQSTLARWVSFVAQRGSGSEERPDGTRVTKMDDLNQFNPEHPEGVIHVYVDDDPSKPQRTPAVLGASVSGVPNQGTRDFIYSLPMLQLGLPIRVVGKKAGIHVTRNEAGEYHAVDSMDYLKHKGAAMTHDESQKVTEGARRLFELELFFTKLPDVAGPSVVMEDK